jgi:hypothetical protein
MATVVPFRVDIPQSQFTTEIDGQNVHFLHYG